MQRDQRFFSGKASLSHAYEGGGYARNTHIGGQYTCGIPVAPDFRATLAEMNQEFASPLDGFEFQPSENCPKNFIIFDQADDGSRVMFHPAMAHKFSCPNFDFRVPHPHDGGKDTVKINENENKVSSFKEDTEDIDALLSSEEDEDDVVSTGRTPGNWGGSSPDSSSSTRGSKSREMKKFTSEGSYSCSASNSERKKERTRKMVRALRGIIPGGEGMDTPAILDEAVRYLKSLKVEVKKLGMENFKN